MRDDSWQELCVDKTEHWVIVVLADHPKGTVDELLAHVMKRSKGSANPTRARKLLQQFRGR